MSFNTGSTRSRHWLRYWTISVYLPFLQLYPWVLQFISYYSLSLGWSSNWTFSEVFSLKESVYFYSAMF
jgi:hypothetical protein